jgi:hypothetical protein
MIHASTTPVSVSALRRIAEEKFFKSLIPNIGRGPLEKAITQLGLDTSNKTWGATDATGESSLGHPFILGGDCVTTVIDGVIKDISISDFKSIISSITEAAEENIPMIALPFGCFAFNRAGDYIKLNCYYKENKVDIRFVHGDRKKEFNIPLPNIIISFVLKRVKDSTWQVHTVKYFSTPKTIGQLDPLVFIESTDTAQGIFKLPISNMYGDNRMCYGSNTMPARFSDNLRGLDYYFQIIGIAPFNSDLGINGISESRAPATWYQQLSTLEAFPYELLKN